MIVILWSNGYSIKRVNKKLWGLCFRAVTNFSFSFVHRFLCAHTSPISDHNKVYFEVITDFTSGLRMASKAHRSYQLLKLFPTVLCKILTCMLYIYMYRAYNCGSSALLWGHIWTGITAIKLPNGLQWILLPGFKFNLLWFLKSQIENYCLCNLCFFLIGC